MVKRYSNLYPHIVTFENLYTAYRKIVAAISKSRDPRHRLPHGAISKSHRGPTSAKWISRLQGRRRQDWSSW
jgi:hypothetical protein